MNWLTQINALRNEKSLGLDGMLVEVFKTFKETLVGPLLRVWEESLTHEALPFSINEGIIKLIHKKDQKDNISNWRLIMILSTTYKIFAKTLARRLSSHQKEWISRPEQKGFIKGRFLWHPCYLLFTDDGLGWLVLEKEMSTGELEGISLPKN